jgi:hypothetical protein
MSERLGRDLPLAEVVPSYVHEVLEQLPAPSSVGVRADEAS